MCYVYVKLIQMGEMIYSGYGMAEDADKTETDENRHLERAGFKVVSTENFKFPNRKEAKAMEDHIKDNTLHVDLKVDRFRTEAAPGQQHSYILRMVAERLAGNKSSTEAPEEQSESHYSDDLKSIQKTKLKKNIAYWEAKLEFAWGSKSIKGKTYREEAKSCLETSLANLYSDVENTSIYFPADWWMGGQEKPAQYNGEGYDDLELDYLRRDIAEERENLQYERKRRAEARVKAKKRAAQDAVNKIRNDWFDSISEEGKQHLINKFFGSNWSKATDIRENDIYTLAQYKAAYEVFKSTMGR